VLNEKAEVVWADRPNETSQTSRVSMKGGLSILTRQLSLSITIKPSEK
jgi:hypothetical protein